MTTSNQNRAARLASVDHMQFTGTDGVARNFDGSPVRPKPAPRVRHPGALLYWHDKEHARAVFQFAKRTGQTRSLKRSLAQLTRIARNYGGANHLVRVDIGRDFAPQSFAFAITKPAPGGERACMLNGGMIYHGADDGGGNGGAPTFSVCLEPTNGWSIHT